MTTTTQLHGLGSYTSSTTLTDFVGGYLGEFAGDYDVDGLVDAFREALNEQLAGHGIRLHGDDFYATYPAPENASDLIRDALETVELGPLAEDYNRTQDATCIVITATEAPDGTALEEREVGREPIGPLGRRDVRGYLLRAAGLDDVEPGTVCRVALVDDDDEEIQSVEVIAQ